MAEAAALPPILERLIRLSTDGARIGRISLVESLALTALIAGKDRRFYVGVTAA